MLDRLKRALSAKNTSNADFFGLALIILLVDIIWTTTSGSNELTSVSSVTTLVVFGMLSTIDTYTKG